MATDFRSVNIVFGIGTESQQVLMPDSRRRAIIFDLAQGGVAWFANREITTSVVGVCSTIVNRPLQLTYRDLGELITAEWFAFIPGGGQILNVTEVFVV